MKILQSIQLFLNPPFMRKADHFLLLNYPRIWSSRIHYVAYYGILANLILNLLVFILLQPHQIDEFIRIIIVIVMLVEVGAFIFWVDEESRFNIEQDYGNINPIGGVIEIFVYAVCILIIISSSLTTTFCAFHKTAHQIRFTDYNYEQYEKHQEYLYNLFEIPNSYPDPRSLLQSIIEKNQEKLTPICREIERMDLDSLELLSNDEKPKVLHQVTTKPSLSEIDKKCTSAILALYYSPVSENLADINHYLKDDFNENTNRLYYDVQYWFHIVFFIVSLLFLIIKKYGSWETVIWLSIYIVLLIMILISATAVLNNFEANFFKFLEIYPNANYETNKAIATLLLITMISIYFYIKLILGKKYNQFLYLHFAILPIVIAIFVFTFSGLYDPDHNYTFKESARVLQGFLLLYICSFPLQKRILTRFISLPKE